jgi:hypothetical protein
VNPETGVTQILRKIPERLLSPVSKQILSIGQFTGLAINDLVDFYGLLEIQPKVEELNLESGIVVSPERLVCAESNGLVIVPGEIFQGLGQFTFMGYIRLSCQSPGSTL